ncbi:helix-turn-helix domain-containing protein [Streptomyces boluensis]|uniref:Helix-turn-helix domain-containing protein n=1 Tax=Streptomyces boluensis TaxID=1775135 RepID=A0A964UR78_9ACTN|nr:helix-turn-helix transcriptional regulator [Streptomyces boluensis]NBE53869.1 helix-turn-helix domain-containing protein [Streptomyces boluensis]
MATLDAVALGKRIAATRKAKKLRQTDLARDSFVSLPMVKAIEQGKRYPSDTTLEALAAALGVDPTRLLDTYTGAETRVHAALPAISAGLAAYDVPLSSPRRTLDELHTIVAETVNWRLAAQYGRIAQHAPALLGDVLAAFHAARDKRAAARLVVAAARSVDAVAYKYGARDLSARLVELMRWAVPYADDPLLTASVAYVRTEVFFTARAHAAGTRALEAAVDAAPAARDEDTAAARGALHMRAAVIAGRDGDADTANSHLTHARRLSEQTREGTYLGTAFGPESVRIHELSVAVSLGQDHVDDALAVAREWTPSKALPAERRSGFWIELARAQMWGSRFNDAFESLKVARGIAPQHTREHPWTRETTGTLVRLRRADEETLHHFASWVGAV